MNLRPRRSSAVSLDLTPLIDVVFLLLIFFMVSTTFDKESQIKVDLPQAAKSAKIPPETKVIDIIIDAKGRIFVNDRELINQEAATLVRELGKVSAGKLDTPVYVRGDKESSYQSLMTVIDAVGQAGLSRMRLVKRDAPREE